MKKTHTNSINSRTKEYEKAKYTIASAKDKSFTATSVDFGTVSAIGLATSDITLSNVTFNSTQPVQIKAKAFEFSGIVGVIETLTVTSIKANGDQSIKLLEKKQSKVDSGAATGSGNIAITVVDKTGKAVASFTKNYTLFSKFGTSAEALSLSNDGFTLSCDAKGKVTVVTKS